MSAFSYRRNPETCLGSFRKIRPKPFLILRRIATHKPHLTHTPMIICKKKPTPTTVSTTGQMSSQNTFISTFFPFFRTVAHSKNARTLNSLNSLCVGHCVMVGYHLSSLDTVTPSIFSISVISPSYSYPFCKSRQIQRSPPG